MTRVIRLHHCHGTRSMRTLWLLHELELDFEVAVYPFDNTLRGDSFRALNTIGRVPVLEIDDEELTETGAIAQYLCERYPEEGLGREPGDLDRGDFLVWLHFAETITHHVTTLTQQHIVFHDPALRCKALMRLEAERLAQCLAAVELRLSPPVENRDNLLTSGFSAADVAVGQAVWMAQHFVRIDRFPETARWLAEFAERPAFCKALPPDGASLYDKSYYDAPDASA